VRVKHLVIGLLALVVVVGALAYQRTARTTLTGGDPDPGSTSTLTDDEKDRVHRFWKTYRQAQQARLEGRWEAAISDYRRALELNPVHEDTLYYLASCQFEINEFDDALDILNRLVRVNPMSHRGYHQIGLVRSCPLAGRLFDLDAAEAALNRALEINQEETGALLRLGEVALAKGDRPRALEFLTLANRSNSSAVSAYYLRAYIQFGEGNLDETRALLREALRQSLQPKIVAGVSSEGDTRSDRRLPPTTVAEKRLVKPFWEKLNERYPDDRIEDLSREALRAEFSPLEIHLSELQAAAEKSRNEGQAAGNRNGEQRR